MALTKSERAYQSIRNTLMALTPEERSEVLHQLQHDEDLPLSAWYESVWRIHDNRFNQMLDEHRGKVKAQRAAAAAKLKKDGRPRRDPTKVALIRNMKDNEKKTLQQIGLDLGMNRKTVADYYHDGTDG